MLAEFFKQSSHHGFRIKEVLLAIVRRSRSMRTGTFTRALAGAALIGVVLAAPAAAQDPGPTIVWGGDTTLGSSYGRPPDRGWPQLAPVASVLRRADFAALNLEGTFGSGGASKCGGGSSNCFAFQAPPANASTLARAGVDVVNQANNHAYDFGPAGYARPGRRCAAPRSPTAARPARSRWSSATASRSPSSASRRTAGARR